MSLNPVSLNEPNKKLKDTKGHSLGKEGMVFSIQRFSLQDGPGIRTTVFLKGCPLRCDWCSNPESQTLDPEIMFRSHNCQSCGTCAEICKVQAITLEDSFPHLNREICTLCMDCVTACLNGALETTGERLTIEAVVEEASKDELFYSNSGGGVTLSGGEPLLQADFAYRLLKGCKEKGLQTALDTCGHISWDAMQRALEYTDLVLFDLKHLKPEKHLQGTCVGNDLILENLKKAVQSNLTRIWIRIPVIEDYNDSQEYFQELAAFLKTMPIEKVSLLAYHEWGKAKYTALDREYPHNSKTALDKERLEPLKEILETAGINVTIDH